VTVDVEFVYNRRSPMRKLVSRVLLGGVLALSGVARAEPPGPGVFPVQVIAIQSEDADDQAESLTAALRSRVRAMRGYSLHDSDFALEVLTLGLKCGDVPDEPCQAKIADQIHADRYIWGAVRRSKTHRQVTADLHLWARGRPAARTQLTFSDNLTAPGDEALKRLVEDALAKLFEVPKPSSPAPPTEPRTPAVLPASIARPAGSAEIPVSTVVDTTAEKPPDGRRTTGWAAVGLGGVLLGAGIYSIVRVQAIDTDQRVQLYRQGFHAGDDVCDEARAGVESKVMGAATALQMRDFCSSATTFQTLQFVFFGLGAVSAGAGIYLLATDRPAATSRFDVLPSVGRNGGRLDVRMSF
jgi:hypothetical protein